MCQATWRYNAAQPFGPPTLGPTDRGRCVCSRMHPAPPSPNTSRRTPRSRRRVLGFVYDKLQEEREAEARGEG